MSSMSNKNGAITLYDFVQFFLKKNMHTVLICPSLYVDLIVYALWIFGLGLKCHSIFNKCSACCHLSKNINLVCILNCLQSFTYDTTACEDHR